jgi:hypothetical protein
MKLLMSTALALVLTTTAPVLAQTTSPAEPDMAVMVENVTNIAEGLSGRVAALSEIIATTTNGDAATRALDEMLEAAREMQADLGPDSAVWSDINLMIEAWGVKRDDLTTRGAFNQALLPVAATWQARIDDAMVLRSQILNQSHESEALIEQIEQQREVVVALWDAALADQALETMRAISAELTEMNDQMTGIVAQAGVVADGASVASN